MRIFKRLKACDLIFHFKNLEKEMQLYSINWKEGNNKERRHSMRLTKINKVKVVSLERLINKPLLEKTNAQIINIDIKRKHY